MGQAHSHGEGHGHSHSHGHGHSHGHSHGHADIRDKMMPATSGTVTGLLTAHLSRADGNELDIFIEDAATQKSLAVPVMRFTAVIDVPSTGEHRSVEFTPADASERDEGDAQDHCSHFAAKTPWMVATSTLSVTVSVQVPGLGLVELAWAGFVPKAFAHHEE